MRNFQERHTVVSSERTRNLRQLHRHRDFHIPHVIQLDPKLDLGLRIRRQLKTGLNLRDLKDRIQTTSPPPRPRALVRIHDISRHLGAIRQAGLQAKVRRRGAGERGRGADVVGDGGAETKDAFDRDADARDGETASGFRLPGDFSALMVASSSSMALKLEGAAERVRSWREKCST